MKSRSSKIAFLFALYAALHFAEACSKDMDCNCPDVLPFFDYKALKVAANTPSPSLGLSLFVEADSVEYLAIAPAPKPLDFGVMSSALACSCLWDGHDGPKHEVQSLNIYADRDFNDTLPEGASLNALFFQVAGDVMQQMTPDYRPDGFWKIDSEFRPIKVMTFEKPDELSVPFIFTVEVVKTNGDTLRVKTGEIYFL